MDWLAEAVNAAKNIEGVVITKLPDCVQWKGYTRSTWDKDEIAAYFGDIARASKNALKTVGNADEIGLTIEASDHIILTRSVREDMVAVFVFDRNAPLGVARLQMRKVCKIIVDSLPSEEVAERSRAERIMEFLLRYAPDAHAVPIRVSLQSGIPLDQIKNPVVLNADQTSRLEAAARSILGVNTLRI